MNISTRYPNLSRIDESTALIRLTALWALSEAGLGGFLHLFRTPFTGLIVGGIAVILLSLMAIVSENVLKSIPRALLLVLIVKMSISPHSPLPAYFAVSFQAFAAVFLFRYIPSFKLACLLLGMLALMESALQKIITLTLIFGQSLWESIDVFANYVIEKMSWFSYLQESHASKWLIIIYISLYAIAGIITGLLSGMMPGKIDAALENTTHNNWKSEENYPAPRKMKKKAFWASKKLRMLVLIFFLILMVYIFVPAAKSIINPIFIFLRVLLILSLWYFIVAPLLMNIFQKFVKKRASAYRAEVDQALSLLPVFRVMIFSIWRRHGDKALYHRIQAVFIDIVANALKFKHD